MTRNLVLLPQATANDETAVLVEWSKEAGAEIRQGQTLCVIETTKSVIDIESEFDGYVYPLVEEGTTVQVGTPIAVVSKRAGEDLSQLGAWVQSQQSEKVPPAEKPASQRRWTKKAEILARRHGLDIEALWRRHDRERLTEADVLGFVREDGVSEPERALEDIVDLVDGRYVQNRAVRVLVIGGGDGAVQVLDAIARSHVHDVRSLP